MREAVLPGLLKRIAAHSDRVIGIAPGLLLAGCRYSDKVLRTAGMKPPEQYAAFRSYLLDEDIRGLFSAESNAATPGWSYRNMWWVSHNELGAFEGRGIHGQRLYVAPAANMVVARFASHPVAGSAANDPITLPALLALGRMLR